MGTAFGWDQNAGGNKRIPTGSYTGYNPDFNKTNYSIGITLDYSLSNKLYVFTGLTYSNRDFTGTFYCEVCDFIVPPQPEPISLSFLEIPVGLRYYLLASRLKPFAEAGLVNQFALQKELTTLEDSSPANAYVLSGAVGLGLEFGISRNIAMLARAAYTRGISNLIEGMDYSLQMFSINASFVARLN